MMFSLKFLTVLVPVPVCVALHYASGTGTGGEGTSPQAQFQQREVKSVAVLTSQGTVSSKEVHEKKKEGPDAGHMHVTWHSHSRQADLAKKDGNVIAHHGLKATQAGGKGAEGISIYCLRTFSIGHHFRIVFFAAVTYNML